MYFSMTPLRPSYTNQRAVKGSYKMRKFSLFSVKISTKESASLSLVLILILSLKLTNQPNPKTNANAKNVN